MKKKFALMGGILLGALSLHAEQLTFITTMSAPVGVFSRVETQTSAMVSSTTTLYNVGELRLTGEAARAVELGNVTLGDNAQITSNAGKLQVAAINVNQGGTLEGKHLIADEIQSQTVSKATVGGTLYSRNLNVDYAKVDSLTITDKTTGLPISQISLPQEADDRPGNLTWGTNTHVMPGQQARDGEVLLKSPSE